MELFKKLQQIDCSKHIEKKNGLSYLSWAWAWQIINENAEKVTYTIYENKDGLNYHHDGKTAWVKTGVTANGVEHIEYLPIMDYKNKSIPLNALTSFDVNKAIQRSLTKAIARHGLGLYIYAGEDLPESDVQANDVITNEQAEEIERLIAETKTDKEKFLVYFKVRRVGDMSASAYEKAKKMLEAKIK